MKVKELIVQLQMLSSQVQMDAEVRQMADGEPRTTVEIVYISRDGDCILIDFDEPVYSWGARPKEENVWYTPKGKQIRVGVIQRES